MQQLSRAAAMASDEIPAWIPQPIRGSLVHARFAAYVRMLGPEFDAEVSYLYGGTERYGTPGSVRADAIYGDRRGPQLAVDLKTGSQYVTRQEMMRYELHLPQGTRVYQIHAY